MQDQGVVVRYGKALLDVGTSHVEVIPRMAPNGGAAHSQSTRNSRHMPVSASPTSHLFGRAWSSIDDATTDALFATCSFGSFLVPHRDFPDPHRSIRNGEVFLPQDAYASSMVDPRIL